MAERKLNQNAHKIDEIPWDEENPKVLLLTGKYLNTYASLITENETAFEKEIQNIQENQIKQYLSTNLPICCTSLKLNQVPCNMLLPYYKNILQNLAKIVSINPLTKKILVYKSENKLEDEFLLDYDAKLNTTPENDFFIRWQETNTAIFEFKTYCYNKLILIFYGIWQNNQWSQLEFVFDQKPLCVYVHLPNAHE